ncbi:MAG: MerR family transcriptional regulator [Siculibacillus sp.]|nr:MerR family transcriptional regulator [Siculibacillus sp.]
MYAHHDEMFAMSELMPVENRPHHIGELAEKFGITLRTIRFYEQKGLINPRRIGTNMRIFDVADVARLGLIVTCRRFRFTVEEISELLAARDALPADAFHTRLTETIARRHAELTAEISELEQVRSDLFGFLADLRRRG